MSKRIVQQLRTVTYFTCPKCLNNIRVPLQCGTHNMLCARCKTEWQVVVGEAGLGSQITVDLFKLSPGV